MHGLTNITGQIFPAKMNLVAHFDGLSCALNDDYARNKRRLLLPDW